MHGCHVMRMKRLHMDSSLISIVVHACLVHVAGINTPYHEKEPMGSTCTLHWTLD